MNSSVFSCYFINLLHSQLLHMTFSSSDHGIPLALNISLTLPKSSSPFRAQIKCTTSPKPYPTRGLIEAQASQLLGHFGWFHWGWHILTCIRIIYCVTYNWRQVSWHKGSFLICVCIPKIFSTNYLANICWEIIMWNYLKCWQWNDQIPSLNINSRVENINYSHVSLPLITNCSFVYSCVQ